MSEKDLAHRCPLQSHLSRCHSGCVVDLNAGLNWLHCSWQCGNSVVRVQKVFHHNIIRCHFFLFACWWYVLFLFPFNVVSKDEPGDYTAGGSLFPRFWQSKTLYCTSSLSKDCHFSSAIREHYCWQEYLPHIQGNHFLGAGSAKMTQIKVKKNV